MKKNFYFLEYLFVKILFFLIRILPINFSKKLSSSIFRILGKLSSADRIAMDNCKFVFPDLEEAKIRNII